MIGFQYGYDGSVIHATIRDTLGISPARMAQLRQEQPILYATEATWMVFIRGVALVLSFLGVAVLWSRFAFQTTPLLMRGVGYLIAACMKQVVISLSGGVIMVSWMFRWLLIMRLRLGLMD
jgi:hypothetical protein